jgi:hypothetical protein
MDVLIVVAIECSFVFHEKKCLVSQGKKPLNFLEKILCIYKVKSRLNVSVKYMKKAFCIGRDMWQV